MRKMIALVAAALVTFSSAMSTQAMTIEDIAAQDDRVTIENGELTYYAKNSDDIWETYRDIIGENVRTHSGYEYTWVSWKNNGNRFKCTIDKNQMERILNEQAWVEDWCRTNVPTFVPNGVDRDVAISMVFHRVVHNFEYDYDLAKNLDTGNSDYQYAASAYGMLQNRKGVCVGLSQVFRVFLEAVPFDPETGLVDWSCENAEHIKVATVENNVHMWDAIQGDDGIWRYYDATDYSTSTGGELFDNNGKQQWHY